MKLAFSTLGCPQWSWDTVLSEASRMGFDGIELRGVDGELCLPKARPFLPEHIEQTVGELRRRKLAIAALDTSCAFHDAGGYSAAVEEGRAAIDLAAKLDSPFIRVFGNNIPNPSARREITDRIIRGLRELCAHCAGKGVSVLLETHGDFIAFDTLAPIIDGVSGDCFGLLLDIGNTAEKVGGDLAPFMRLAAPHIRHAHVKDAKLAGGAFQLCLTGEGDVPIEHAVQLLAAAGYDGFLSFEWEKKWHAELEEPEVAFPGYMAYMKRLLKA